MTKKAGKLTEQKRQQKLMKKRTRDKQRQKHQPGQLSENAIQHKMVSSFGNVTNFVRNVQHLSAMFKAEDDLKTVRFDAGALYGKMDLAESRNALADLYSQADYTGYAEEFESFWKEKRRALLPDLLTEEFISSLEKILKKLMVTKKGFKKDYRAVLAGFLLLESHQSALTETKTDENQLWEIIFNATLKDNPVELPPPAPVAEPTESTEATAAPPEVEEPPKPAE